VIELASGGTIRTDSFDANPAGCFPRPHLPR
jgi:hypothetical protein